LRWRGWRACQLIHESNFSARIDPTIDARFYRTRRPLQAAQAARDAGVRTLALVT
jgi:hypothetical protein